ncbi:MAG: hypothetical protein CL672_01010 [Balneola sp.]|nr:hypothetical protein [Balneola sp.]|tara:strand:- start:13785 stop:14642 length:858 start_codon:yes stop_codon:yes gene_type:complete
MTYQALGINRLSRTNIGWFAILSCCIVVGSVCSVHAQGGAVITPESTELYVDLAKISPGLTAQMPPSDATVLFDGTDLAKWQAMQLRVAGDMPGILKSIADYEPGKVTQPAQWKVADGIMTVEPGTGAIETKRHFGDMQLHLEWNAPVAEEKSGQGYSNSGVFFMGLYEVQILNSYKNTTYNNGQASSVYKQHIPLVNASRAPGQWQSYDIIFMAPRFSEKGSLISPVRLTVFHNGVLVQNNVELLGPTTYIGASHYTPHPEKMPLALQDHGDPVQFRNIWIREL